MQIRPEKFQQELLGSRVLAPFCFFFFFGGGGGVKDGGGGGC